MNSTPPTVGLQPSAQRQKAVAEDSRMTLGFCTLGCPAWTLERIAEYAATRGFDGVELRTGDESCHLPVAGGVEEARRVGRVFADRKARVLALMGYTSFVSENPAELDQNRDKLMLLADMAAVLGAPYIRAFVGRLPSEASRERILERVARPLREACRHAAACGVRVGIETHDDWCQPAVIMDLVRRVGPELGVVWDICNATHATGLSVAEQYAGLRDVVVYCHVKDAVARPDGKLAYVPVGRGTCDIAGAVGCLRRDGRNVFLSFEHEKRWIPELPEPEEAFPQYLAYMRPLLK